MRLLPCLLVIALSACGNPPPGGPAEVPVPEVEPAHVEVKVTVPDSSTSLQPAADAARSDSLPRTKRIPASHGAEDGGCTGYAGYANGVGTITTHIPKSQWPEREVEVLEMLPTVFTMAEESAPRYIADDFEHGISTEHSTMPDTLPVMVSVLENCRASRPYVKLRYRVWRSGDGGFGTDGP